MNTYDLKGRTAVITGGGSGIGLAAAKRFLQSGASVEIWGRSVERLKGAQKELSEFGPISIASVDVSDWQQVKASAAAALVRHGKVDILFNCAGLALEVGPLVDMDVENWQATIAVNLQSAFYGCKAFAPGMIANGYGRIINTSSMAGKDGNPYMSAYSSAKAGVIALTKSFGKELATTGVLVNCVCPTVFNTPLARETIAEAPDAMAASIAKIPMLRMGEPEEAAALVTWLASEDCSYNTGFTFDLSGGRAVF